MVDESRVEDTPLVELDLDVAPTVYAKVEWLNFHGTGWGGGSVKSRIAVAMLDRAEERGLSPGSTLLEVSSGNTASEVARVGANRGYDVEVVMPDDAATGKREAVREAGGTIHEVPRELGYDALYEHAKARVEAGAYHWLNQYQNPANPGAHVRTGREIVDQTDGRVTAVVAGAGTGGTVTGIGRALRVHAPDARVVGFEPAHEDHGLYGLKYLRTGEHMHPGTYDESVLDEQHYVDTEDAHREARALRRRFAARDLTIHDSGQYDEATVRDTLRVDGDLLVGPSTGATFALVESLCRAGEFDGSDVLVAPFFDRGDKYPDGALWGDRLGG